MQWLRRYSVLPPGSGRGSETGRWGGLPLAWVWLPGRPSPGSVDPEAWHVGQAESGEGAATRPLSHPVGGYVLRPLCPPEYLGVVTVASCPHLHSMSKHNMAFTLGGAPGDQGLTFWSPDLVSGFSAASTHVARVRGATGSPAATPLWLFKDLPSASS